MRFFTNDSKDDRDDPKDVDVQDRSDYQPEPQAHPEAVSSDPVPVPQQRANSPWSSAPDNDGVAAVPAGSVDTTDEHDTDRHDRDDDRVDDDRVDETDRADTDRADTDRVDETDRTDGTNRVDEALDDRGTFDDPQVSDSGHAPSDSDSDRDADRLVGKHEDTGRHEDGEHVHEDPTPPDHAVADTAPDAVTTHHDGTDETALKDEGDFDDPKAVDPATDEPLSSADKSADAVPVAAAGGATDSKPGEVAAPEVTSLFGSDSQAFQDRWRDVQLRFVDSPKEATAEAAKLVDEAVDRLTASLKSQKDQFGGESTEDTEKLRVQLRGYRDILNRIIAL